MPSNFPTGVDSLPTNHQDNVNEVIAAATTNNIAAAINAIEPWLRGFNVVLATTYGADPTGVSDSAPSINNAIAALANTGGTVYLPAGTYKCSSTINIGNGTGSGASFTDSTQAPVTLQGCMPSFNSGHGPAAAQTKLQIASGVAVGVQFNGPFIGGGLRDLFINATDATNNYGLLMNDTHMSRIQNVCVQNFSSVGVLLRAQSAAASQHNVFDQLSVTLPDVNNVIGIKCSGSAAVAQTTYNNSFRDVELLISSATNHTVNMFYMDLVDSTVFEPVNLYIFKTGAGVQTNIWPITLDYSVTATFPSENRWRVMDFSTGVFGSGNGVRNIGTPVNASPNRVMDIEQENGYPANPALANLLWGYSAIT